MPWIGKFLLFFSSWAPAYGMIALIASDSLPAVSLTMAAATGLSIVLYFVVEHLLFAGGTRALKIKSISRRDENVVMYIIAYLPPFFSVDYSKIGPDLAVMAFYIFFSFTYVVLGLYYLNPMFIFRGYRTFTIISEGGSEYVALIRGKSIPEAGDTVEYRGRDEVLLIRQKSVDSEEKDHKI
jgi:hypothetical protein